MSQQVNYRTRNFTTISMENVQRDVTLMKLSHSTVDFPTVCIIAVS